MMREVVDGFWVSDWLERTALVLQIILLAGGIWSANYVTALIAVPATVALVRLARLRAAADEMAGGAQNYLAEPEPGKGSVRYGTGGDDAPPPPESAGGWRGSAAPRRRGP